MLPQNIQTSYIIDSLPKKFFEGQQNVIILLIDSGWTPTHSHKNTLCSQMKKEKAHKGTSQLDELDQFLKVYSSRFL